MNILKKKTPTPDELEVSLRSQRITWLWRFLLDRRFALLWTGQTISAFGSAITGLGFPLVALLLLRATPEQIGLLTALGTLPGLLVGLFIGAWIDRLPKPLVLIVADLVRALLLALIPLLTLSGLLNMNWLYGINALVGLFTLSFEVASLSFLPLLLPSERLAEGNSRLGTSDALAEIAGLPLAGLLIQLLTAPVAILLDSCSFLCSALCVGLMRVPASVGRAATRQVHIWREIREGLAMLAGDPILRALAAYNSTQTFFGGAYAALYVLYAFQLFGTSPLACSVLIAAGGIGALVGSFIATTCMRRFGQGRVLIGSALGFALISFTTPLASGPVPVLFGLLMLAQLSGDTGYAMYAIGEVSLRQALIPEHLTGRVNASFHLLTRSTLPLGAVLAGIVSEFIGIRLTLLIGSSGFLLATAWLIFSPLPQKDQHSTEY